MVTISTVCSPRVARVVAPRSLRIASHTYSTIDTAKVADEADAAATSAPANDHGIGRGPLYGYGPLYGNNGPSRKSKLPEHQDCEGKKTPAAQPEHRSEAEKPTLAGSKGTLSKEEQVSSMMALFLGLH